MNHKIVLINLFYKITIDYKTKIRKGKLFILWKRIKYSYIVKEFYKELKI